MENNLSIKDYISRQEENATYQFSNNMTEFLAATTYERIYRHAKEYNWNISYVKHTDQKKVLVIEKAKNKFPELWVSSTYTRYRHAFRNFLNEYFKIDKIPANYHVDHVISRKIFLKKHPEYFIRLFLLDRKTNCKYGALYEKLLAHFENKKDINGGYHISYMNMAKIYNIGLPKYSSSLKQFEQWAENTAIFFGKKINENPDHIKLGLLLTLHDGYKNFYFEEKCATSIGYMAVNIKNEQQEDSDYK